jgi:hypothetical protein
MRRSEQETIFRFSGDEDFVNVYTAHPPTHRKLERLGYGPRKVTTRDGEPNGWFFRVPIEEFKWRAGKGKKRVLSPEQAQAGADKLRAARLAARLAPVSTANSKGTDREKGGAL